MLYTFRTAVLTACFSIAPLFAGALVLDAGKPDTDPEATAKNAAVVARMSACHSPEKTTITATAEGILNGKRLTIPLKVIRLATPGTFAVTHEWPKEGNWAVKMIASNPEYKDYSTAVLVPVQNDVFRWSAVKHIFHVPTPEEIDAVLGQNSI